MTYNEFFYNNLSAARGISFKYSDFKDYKSEAHFLEANGDAKAFRMS